MEIKNKISQEFFAQWQTDPEKVAKILDEAYEDCYEASVLVNWGRHALEAIEALGMELSHYAHIAGETAPKPKAASFDEWAEKAKEAITNMEAIHDLCQNGTI